MMETLVEEKIDCVHCGAPCPDIRIKIEAQGETEEKHFCCEGCKTVYQILAEHDISIDALLQRPGEQASAGGGDRTDVIILTHDTVEGRMSRAIAQMQALPTVLAPIVRIRKEELG